MKRMRGISLITLVITIVIIIILAGIVILNLSQNNPIKNSEKARIMEDVSAFASDLAVRISKLYADNPGLNMKNIDSSEDEENKYYITKLVSSVEKEKVGSVLYSDILIVRDGALYFNEDKKDLVSQDEYNAIIEVLGIYSPKNQDKKDDETEEETPGEEPGDNPSGNEPVVPDTNTYTITYKLNDGTDTTYTTQTKNKGENITIIPDQLTREGYAFLGWSENKDSADDLISSGSTYTNDANLTLYAIWEKNVYILTINHYLENQNDSNYTLSKTTTETISHGETITLKDYSETITNGEYSYASVDGNNLETLLIDEAKEINIYYARDRYILTLSKGDYITEVTGAGEYKVGQSVAINATVGSYSGYTTKWSQWTSSNTNLISNKSVQNVTITMPAGNVTLTASATRTAKTSYTVTYNANGGTGTMAAGKKYSGEAYTIQNCTFTAPDGYTFGGWATATTQQACGTLLTVTYDSVETGASNPDAPTHVCFTIYTCDKCGYEEKTYSYDGYPAKEVKYCTEIVDKYSSATYNVGDNYNSNSNLDLYAIWMCTGESDGISTCTDTETVTCGGSYSITGSSSSSKGTYCSGCGSTSPTFTTTQYICSTCRKGIVVVASHGCGFKSIDVSQQRCSMTYCSIHGLSPNHVLTDTCRHNCNSNHYYY